LQRSFCLAGGGVMSERNPVMEATVTMAASLYIGEFLSKVLILILEVVK
jgi:hypothetical protein